MGWSYPFVARAPVVHHGIVFGREVQWSLVTELVTGVAAGARAALLVDGPPGTGRTTLLRAAVAEAARRGLSVSDGDTPAQLVAVDDVRGPLPAAVLSGSTGFLITARAAAEFPPLADVPVTRTTLGPLGDTDVARLVSAHLDVVEPDVQPLIAAAGGNPLLLTALLTGLRDDPVRMGTPVFLRELLRRRLPVDAWQLLRVAAVLGRSCQMAELAAMTRRATAELLPTVDVLLDAGMLDWVVDDLTFRHELVWWAALDAVPPGVRNAMRDDRDRIRGARAASVAALPAPLVADDLARSVVAVRAALARPAPPRMAPELHGLLANLLLLKGDSGGARTAAEEVLACADTTGALTDEATAARVAAMALGGDARAEQAAETVLSSAPPTSTAAVAAAFVLSNVWWERGQLEDAMRMAQHRANVGAGGSSPHWWLWQRLALVNKLTVGGRLAEANAMMAATRERMAKLRLSSYEGNRSIVESHLLLVGGRLAAAADRAAAGIAAARSAGIPLLVPFGLCVLASVALADDDIDTADARLAETAAALAACDCVPSSLYGWVSLRLAAARDGARRAAALATEELAGGSPLLVAEPGAAAWLVRTAHDAGDEALARRVVVTAERLAAANPGFPAVVAAARTARAAVRVRRQKPSGWATLSAVERAIAQLVAQGMTNRQIATRVRLSPHTVNYHLRGMFRKLDVSSRAELVRHVPAAA